MMLWRGTTPIPRESSNPKENARVAGGNVNVAKSLHMRGKVAEAELLYRDVLREHAGNLDALEGLGVLLFQSGRIAEAADLFARGIALLPGSARFHANVGESLRSLDKPDEALAHLRLATEIDPKLPHAWNSLALLAQSQGRYSEAETSCRMALKIDPRLTAAYINLGNALSGMNRPAEAAEVLRAALSIEPNNPITLMNLGSALGEMKDPALLREAETLCRRAVALAPQISVAHRILANILRLQGRLDEARACLERAIGPGAGPAAAEPKRETAASESAQAHHAQGMALLERGGLEQAEQSFKRALELDPALASAWNALARIHAERGDLEKSCQAARAAIAARPRRAEAYWRLATALKGALEDGELQAMLALGKDESLSGDEKALLGFGMAAVLERRGDFTQAAKHLAVANAHHSAAKAARGLAFDPDVQARLIDQTISTFTADFLACRRGWGISDGRPVFIVGLPRSGTTLVEQIIAAHPQVHGAGELAEVLRTFHSLPELVRQPAQGAFGAVAMLDAASAQAAARGYLERLEKLAPSSAARVIDKNPENNQYLGLIALLWPGARVIVCRRDLRDVAVSCWRTSLPAVPWSSDWNHLAQVFALNDRLMEHWKTTRPVEWLDLDYEELVADVLGQSRRLIAYLGLPWDPACLSFYKNKRVVRTPSLVQVRQPIHADSVGMWRKYQPSLSPLFEAFERYGVKIRLLCRALQESNSRPAGDR